MPIKESNGVITKTQIEDKTGASITGVWQHDDFAISHPLDPTKQIQFAVNKTATGAAGTTTVQCDVGNSPTTINLSSLNSNTAFSTVQPPNGTSPTATAANDTLTLTSSDSSITITGTASSKTVDFTSSTVTPTTRIALDTFAGFGSTNTNAVRFTNITDNSGGSDLTYTASATLGDKITVNTAGSYGITFSFDGPVANQSLQVSILRNATTAEMQTLGMDAAPAHRVAFDYLPPPGAAEQVGSCAGTIHCAVGDVITFTAWSAGATNPPTPNAANRCMAIVTRCS